MEGKVYLTSPSPLAGEGRGEGEPLIVQVDPHCFRPNEVKTLLGDATRAREKLGWQPKVSFDALVSEDLKAVERDQLIQRQGYRVMDRHE